MLIAQNVSAAADFKTFISYSNNVASGDGILEFGCILTYRMKWSLRGLEGHLTLFPLDFRNSYHNCPSGQYVSKWAIQNFSGVGDR
jgi:hypothetical protein